MSSEACPRLTISVRVMSSYKALSTPPKENYHVPRVFLNSKLTLTRKARSTTHIQIRTHSTTCVDAASTSP